MSGELGVDELRSLFLFEQLTDEQLAWIAERADVRTFDEGVVVYREGEPSEHLYVLLDGGLRLMRLVGAEDVVVNETTHRGSGPSNPDASCTSGTTLRSSVYRSRK